jgi:hypothetical protein
MRTMRGSLIFAVVTIVLFTLHGVRGAEDKEVELEVRGMT